MPCQRSAAPHQLRFGGVRPQHHSDSWDARASGWLARSDASTRLPSQPRWLSACTGRALVTANIKDFIPLDARYRAASQPGTHQTDPRFGQDLPPGPQLHRRHHQRAVRPPRSARPAAAWPGHLPAPPIISLTARRSPKRLTRGRPVSRAAGGPVLASCGHGRPG